MTDWRENDGTVPPEVGPDTVVEVEYRDGRVRMWGQHHVMVKNDAPTLWSTEFNCPTDIIRWRIPA